MDRTRTALASVATLSFILLAPPVLPASTAATDPGPPPVVAYSDTGINPYHVAFRAPTWTDHPSTFIPGYPSSAKALNLTLDADSFDDAWEADQDIWDSVERGQLYYVPGTRIVGMIAIGTADTTGNQIYDDKGHGTLVADAGTGAPRGAAPGAAIVMTVVGNGHTVWVLEQSWIDVYSRSWADLGHVGLPPVEAPTGFVESGPSDTYAAYRMAQEGRTVVNGAGNGPVTGNAVNMFGSRAGPPWVLTVGAAKGEGSAVSPYQACSNCGRPWEVMAPDRGTYALTDTMTDNVTTNGGTSAAGPQAAGYVARLVDDARDRLGDTGNVHTHPGVYAKAADGVELPDRGPLADGELNRTEVEHVLRRTAIPVDHPVTTNPEIQVEPRQASYWYQGYGLVNDTTYEHARRVLLGQAPMPDRSRDDAWHQRFDRVARAYWEPWFCAYEADGDVTEWPGCWTEQVAGLGG